MKSVIALFLFLFSLQAFAADLPNPQYLGGIGINPSQDAKILADWYSKIGIATQAGDDGGFYTSFDTPAGPFYFGIHKKDPNASKTSSASVSFTFRVVDLDRSLSEAAKQGVTPFKPIDSSPIGRFAYFKDPDGNEVSLWGK